MPTREGTVLLSAVLLSAVLATGCAVPCVDDGFLAMQHDPACLATSATTTTSASTSDASTTSASTNSASTDATTTSTGTAATDPTTSTSTDTQTSTSTASTSSGGPLCGCTDDLRNVLCDGVIVEACGIDDYCVDGACAPFDCQTADLRAHSEGCKFWAPTPERHFTGGCVAAWIVNTWVKPVHLEIEYKGQLLPVESFTYLPKDQGGGTITYPPYDAVNGLPVGETALVFLSGVAGDLPDCPMPAAVAMETEISGTGRGDAFSIGTDYPVAAYLVQRYNTILTADDGSATLLLPTTAWDSNYILANAYAQSAAFPTARPLVAIVAAEDATEITIRPKVAIEGGPGVAAGPAGAPIKYTLNRGETIQLAQSPELTGSPLAATKPVGVFGGSSCMSIPADGASCDSSQQQLAPIRALGSTYVAVRHRDRVNDFEEAPPWRLIGAVDGTTLTWTPAKPPGAPATLDLGEVAEFTETAPFTVSSQDEAHPFHLAAYMTGAVMATGDSEWVPLVPPAQYLTRYVFFTDLTYPETSLVVVRRQQDGAFAEVNLMCHGLLQGWAPIDGLHEYARLNLVTGPFIGVGACSNGRHEIASEGPIGVTVWGWGATQETFYRSYAYPAGAAAQAINDLVIQP